MTTVTRKGIFVMITNDEKVLAIKASEVVSVNIESTYLTGNKSYDVVITTDTRSYRLFSNDFKDAVVLIDDIINEIGG